MKKRKPIMNISEVVGCVMLQKNSALKLTGKGLA